MSCWLSSLRIFLLAAILSALTENASDNCVFFIYLLVVFCIFVHPHCLNDNENWQCGWFEEDRFCIRRQNEQPREPLPLWYCVSHRLDRIYNSLSLSGHHWRHLRQTLSCATVYQTKATRQDGCFPVNRAHRTLLFLFVSRDIWQRSRCLPQERRELPFPLPQLIKPEDTKN